MLEAMRARRRARARVLTAGVLLVAAIVGGAAAGPVHPVHASDYPTIDGDFEGIGAISPAGITELTVVGRGGVPATGVGSVALNVTVTNPTADGFVTVWPSGLTRPTASNLNFVKGQTVPNMAIVPVGDNGEISIFNSIGFSDIIVDVLGWFPAGQVFTGLTPARLLDTRPGQSTIDGAGAGSGKLTGPGSIDFAVSGRGGVPLSGVGSVALNVTAVLPTADGFVTVWPSGLSRPTASNLNLNHGRTTPNMVIVPVGADGRVSLFGSAGRVDLVVDVLGWFAIGQGFTGLTPARLMDTRPGQSITDGRQSGLGAVPGGSAVDVSVVGRGGVPSGAGAVALNVTATDPTSSSFLTVWPTGASRPVASNLNVVAGQTAPNMVIVPIGRDGAVSIYNAAGNTDLVVDVLGWFPASGSFVGLTPARLLDTRTTPAPPTIPPPPGVLTLNAGTYATFTQIPPGRFIAERAVFGCSWARLSGTDGTTDEIIANGFQDFAGPMIVDVDPSDAAFSFNAKCGQLAKYVAPAAAATTISPGAHVVGSDIVAGTYTAAALKGCHWDRLSSFSGMPSAVRGTFSFTIDATAFVTISAGDAGFAADAECGTWSKVNA